MQGNDDGKQQIALARTKPHSSAVVVSEHHPTFTRDRTPVQSNPVQSSPVSHTTRPLTLDKHVLGTILLSNESILRDASLRKTPN
jgi:hypothetical protein